MPAESKHPNGSSGSQETLYIVKITILRATSVPVADLHNLSCDPYIRATLSVEYGPDPSDLHIIEFRTPTARRTLDPEFNAPWIVSGIPASGFLLSMKLRDEDPRNYDDDLGKCVVRLPWPQEDDNMLHEGWASGDREYKVHKRRGSVLSRLFTCFANVVTWGDIGHRVRLWLRADVVGVVEDQASRRLYTLGPRRYVRHFSPLLGKFLGSSNSPDSSPSESTRIKPGAFISNRLQLTGPVPASLRHRYVDFAPFVKRMFRRNGVRGVLLHHALHRQHMSIYRWDANTVWGIIGEGADSGTILSNEKVEDVTAGDVKAGIEKAGDEKAEDEKGGDTNATADDSGGNQEGTQTEQEAAAHKVADEGIELAKRFLRMTSYGTHGRIFTYVIMLDGEWRFTETGEHLAIQFLSKHTMHSDVAIEVAYSGEFFVRPLRRRHGQDRGDGVGAANPESETNQHHEETHVAASGSEPPQQHEILGKDPDHADPTAKHDHHELDPDPSQYELVIDNDSGTYRPRSDLLPTLRAWLASPQNLGALGRVTCVDAFDERQKRWKEERKKVKETREGKAKGVQRQVSVSAGSETSSSVSGISGEVGSGVDADVDAGQGEEQVRVTKEDMLKAVEEDAKRARENQDTDRGVQEEQKIAEKLKKDPERTN